MEEISTRLTTLEELLVREFRACQVIHALTREERQALTRNDTRAVSAAVEEKEALLDELGQVEDQRRMLAQELARELGIAGISPPTIAEIATALGAEEGGRINRLREGILALSGEIRELTSGNRALAVAALERVDAVQTFLLNLYRPSLFYQPPGPLQMRAESDAAWGVDLGT
jgi:hypothetical protein